MMHFNNTADPETNKSSNRRLTVALSHAGETGASKRATNQKEKALFNWEILSKHDQLSLSDISLELFLIQIVFKTSDNIHSYYLTTVTNRLMCSRTY